MRGLWQTLDRFILEGGQACLITVLDVQGSAPREVGTRMLVRADGRHSGTIGGGALEWHALAQAQRLMQYRPEGSGSVQSHALGPELGQCCGGKVTLLIECLCRADRGWIAPLLAAEAAGTLRTLGKRDERGIFRRTPAALAQSSLSSCALKGDMLMDVFFDPTTSILLFGAGHVGRALVLALAPLPFCVRWVDAREEAFPAAFPPNVTPVQARDPVSEVFEAAQESLLLAMTHSHPLDLAIVAAALQRPAIAFAGVIGSATKAARFRAQLLKAGLSAERVAELVCPIGMLSLGSKEPAIIAAGIAVQMLQQREILLRRAHNPGTSGLLAPEQDRNLA